MTFPSFGIARCVARFNLGPGISENENASCTLHFRAGVQNLETEGARKVIANEVYEAWAAYITAPEGQFSTAVRLMEVRCYDMNSNRRADGPPGISDKEPVKGTRSTNQHPFQVSNVLTMVASAGGKGRFGRIYLPPQSFTMDTDTGRIKTDETQQMLDSGAAFLNDASNRPLLDLGWELMIWGRTGGGTTRKPVEIRFGRVPDTQRRRRTNLSEAYIGKPFSA